MSPRSIGVVMNGVTGRMGYRQHLVRSVLAINEQGGVALADGSRIMLKPVLVGRNAEKLAKIAADHGIADWTTDLDAALADDDNLIYFDTQVTQARVKAVLKAVEAGKHIYAEKPIAETFSDALALAEAATAKGVKNGVVQDKLFLPGLLKLKRLIDGGFFGRILSVRGEFGYWVFEGDWQAAQRPSWNYRAEDGGGIVLDMFPHWAYVLENLFGRIRSVYAQAVTHVPERVDERGMTYPATADDAAYGVFELEGGIIAQINSSWNVRVNRDELVEFQVDGTHGSAVAGLRNCRVQHRATTPKPVWNPDLPATARFRDGWQEVPDNAEFDNGFKVQWEMFIRHVVEDAPFPYDFVSGARGVRIAELGLRSSAEGLRLPVEPMMRIALPGGDHTLREPVTWARPAGPARSRIAYAAAHVIADPLGDNTPGSPAVVDWETTLRFRRHLWSYGLRIADAMDTAQRNMGLDWAATRELIQRSAGEAKEFGDPATLVACGAGTDHAPRARTLDEIVAAYTEQIETVRDAGAGVVVMASRQLAAIARGPEDYHRVYGRLLTQTDRPVILHWLGEMFDPGLAGYWGSGDVAEATASFLALIREHAPMVDGVKVSLLDAEHEIGLRAALPEGVRLYTGDDFNYPSLIRSGSHALLGIFDAIAPAAAAALQALDDGRPRTVRRDHGPDGPALPEDLRDADLQLQDRHRLPGLAQRPPERLQHDQRRPGGPLDPAPVRGVPPGRPGRAAGGSRAGGHRMRSLLAVNG